MNIKKDFETWNKLKQIIEGKESVVFVHNREIWWCSLGINIGTEIDGKNELYERPCLMLNVYNKESALVLPISTVEKKDKFHFELKINDNKKVYFKLTQMRVISLKRVIRKISTVNKKDFSLIKNMVKDFM